MEDVSLLLIDVFLKERNLAEQQWVRELKKKKKIRQCFLKVVIQIFKYSIFCQLIVFCQTLTIWTDSYEAQFDPDTIYFPILTYIVCLFVLTWESLSTVLCGSLLSVVLRLYPQIKQTWRWCSLLQLVENCLFRAVFCPKNQDISWLHFEARVRKLLCTCWAMWMMPSYFHYSYNRDW